MSTSLKTLQRLDMAQVAERLQIHPFELVRCLVNLERLPADLRFASSELEDLRSAVGIQTWFPEGRTRGPSPAGLVQDLAHQLVSRGVVGEAGTRLDNCTRGLSEEEDELALQVLRALVAEGMLSSWTSELGVQIAIEEGKEYRVADLAEGGTPPPGVSALLQAAVN